MSIAEQRTGALEAAHEAQACMNALPQGLPLAVSASLYASALVVLLCP